MNKPAHRPPAVAIVNRPNEGTVIDSRLETRVSVDGKTVSSMGADLSKAPVPDRRFTADTCTLIASPNTLKIVFGQERIDGKGLRSAIVVQMSRNAGVNFVRTIDAMDGPSLADIVKDGKISPERSTVTEEPAQALSLSANTPITAISGHEACIDFYQISAFAMSVASRSQKLAVEPVVRVTLRTSLVYGLVVDLRSSLSSDLEEVARALGEKKP
jgi:hypothetical protein